jgi:transposase
MGTYVRSERWKTIVDRESPEKLLTRGVSVEQIAKRVGKDPSTVSYWVAKHGLKAPNREKHAAKGGVDRHRLQALVHEGMTIAEIAAELDRSNGTVRHWMRKYGLQTRNALWRTGARRQSSRAAGLPTVTMACKHHGETEFVLEGRGYYRCKRCRADGVVRHRRRLKAILVEEAGRALRALWLRSQQPHARVPSCRSEC